jgi:hypothetical protein
MRKINYRFPGQPAQYGDPSFHVSNLYLTRGILARHHLHQTRSQAYHYVRRQIRIWTPLSLEHCNPSSNLCIVFCGPDLFELHGRRVNDKFGWLGVPDWVEEHKSEQCGSTSHNLLTSDPVIVARSENPLPF